MPGVSMQEALDALAALNKHMLTAGFSVDYSGQARAFPQSGNTLAIAFLLSLLTIYLFLVAQFESLRDLAGGVYLHCGAARGAGRTPRWKYVGSGRRIRRLQSCLVPADPAGTRKLPDTSPSALISSRSGPDEIVFHGNRPSPCQP
jgi:hypothetical protein